MVECIRVITERSDGTRDTQEVRSIAMGMDRNGPFLLIMEPKEEVVLTTRPIIAADDLEFHVHQQLRQYGPGDVHHIHYDFDERSEAAHLKAIVENRSAYPTDVTGVYTAKLYEDRTGVNVRIERVL